MKVLCPRKEALQNSARTEDVKVFGALRLDIRAGANSRQGSFTRPKTSSTSFILDAITFFSSVTTLM